jgi:hypothetical protein
MIYINSVKNLNTKNMKKYGLNQNKRGKLKSLDKFIIFSQSREHILNSNFGFKQ